VIEELNKQIEPDNKRAVESVIMHYHMRIAGIEQRQGRNIFNNKEKLRLMSVIFEWEKENTIGAVEHGEIDPVTADHFVGLLNHQIKKLSKGRYVKPSLLSLIFLRRHSNEEERRQFHTLMESNNAYVLNKLKELQNTTHDPSVEELIADYEHTLPMRRNMDRQVPGTTPSEHDKKGLKNSTSLGFQLERDAIQAMFENGRISRETAKKMRNNIALLEIQLEQDEI
jgi:CPA1 family monovalent cation:H+ antiporter